MPDMTTLCLQADGTIAANADGTLADMTQEAFDACCCGASPDWLQIADYTDGDIASCAACASPGGLTTVWLGNWQKWASPFGGVFWRIPFPGLFRDMIMDSKRVYSESTHPSNFRSYIALSGPFSELPWDLVIACPSFTTIWHGQKNVGVNDPRGTYTRVDGCNSSLSSLTIVAGTEP